jgi:hypothetical protein
MTAAGSVGRAIRGAALLFALLLLLPAGLWAQEPPEEPRPEPADTVEVPIPPEAVAQDTIPVATAEPADTLRSAPNLPRFPRLPTLGFAQATWEWDEAELARWHGMSLLALLEQVPGLLVTRGGWYGRPAGIAAFGAGGGRTRVFLDGYELDPLDGATFDVQYLAITDLDRVRVERTLSETRIELFTFRQPDARAYSQIEVGTALFRTRILRGLFSTPIGDRSLVTVGLDLTDSDGWIGQQPFSANSLLARYGYSFDERTGVQLEYRQTRLQRAGAPFTYQGDRRDLILRGRAAPLPGLGIDALVGRSSQRPDDAVPAAFDLQTVQGALRAHYEHGMGWVSAGARARGGSEVGFPAPTLDLSGHAGLRPLPMLLATGEVRSSRIGDITGTELQGGVRVGPFAGLSLFAGAATGSRGISLVRDTIFLESVLDTLAPEGSRTVADTVVRFPATASELGALRVGAEWSRWGIRMGAAWVTHDLDVAAPFGLTFDRPAPLVAAGTATGIEAFGSVPLIYRPVRLEGSYTRWTDTGGRPYLPLDAGRLALVFNERFYGGNLEPTLRVEAVHRGSAFVPNPDLTAFDALSPAYTLWNLFLQIRILDVQAFLIWDNLLNNALAADVAGPGRILGGQRAIYGVRWHFFD